MAGLTAPQLVLFAILLAAFVLLVAERIRNDVVAVLIILALAVTRVLEPAEALAGFGGEPAIVVAAIFVLGGALHQTGLSEMIGRGVVRVAGGSWARAILVIMPSVALLSAFTHHVTTTAVMLPVVLALSSARGLPASTLLMPLSFAASLGTTITIIGAPAFLIASGVLQRSGRPGLGIFSIAPIGLGISAAGTLFILLVGRVLLPRRKGGEDAASRFRLDDYFTELTILPDSPFLDKTVAEVAADPRYRFEVVGWVRNGRRMPEPFGPRRLAAGDVLLVRASPEQVVGFRHERGVELHPVEQYQADTKVAAAGGPDDDVAGRLVQAVVAPGSDLAGRTIAQIDFRRRYGAIVLSLWRRESWIDQELSRIRLRGGDVLVLQGDEEALDRVARDGSFLMLMPFQAAPRLPRKAPLAAAIMLATIALASFGWLPLEIATLAGAAAMVLTGCITLGQAYRSIDTRIYAFIAGAMPLGTAMTKTRASELIAGWLRGALEGWSQFLVLLAIFAVVAVLTQFMSDAATTALFAPIAVALARGLGHAPEPYVVTVAMAAVGAFLTPIGHHGNLLVYGPGGYRFGDFVRVGTPLTVVVALIVVVLAPLLWPGP